MEQQQPQPQIAVDPNLAAEQQQADRLQISALQQQTQGDTAELMARYGTRLALGSSLPLSTPNPSSAPSPMAGA